MSGLVMALVFSGCAARSQNPDAIQTASQPVRVLALKGPTGVGMVHLMHDHPDHGGEYEYTITDSPDAAVAKLISKEVDLAAVPTNLAAVLSAKTAGGVQMLAVNTLGVLYIVSRDQSVHRLTDLKGKTVHATGQGSNPEYVLRHLLDRAGLDPDRDVKIVFDAEHAELATKVADGSVDIALLPEPFVTMVTSKDPTVTVAIDLTAEWNASVSDGSQLMMGALIGRTDYVAAHPALVETFLKQYRASVQAATADVPATAVLCQSHGIIASAALAEKAIPRLNLVFLTGRPMRTGLTGYYRILYDANPQSVGGAIPDATFFYGAD